MKKKKIYIVFQIIISIFVVIAAVFLYIQQMNNAVATNTMDTIQELSQHDKRSIESFIETSWKNLDAIRKRFVSYNCTTLADIQNRMNLECATAISEFSHMYLVAEDGAIYTDKYVTYDPKLDPSDEKVDLLSLFANDKERIVIRRRDMLAGNGDTNEYILYGVRLNDFQVEGVSMRALIGLTEISVLQQHIILNSFEKNGVRRGYSTIIRKNGDFITTPEKKHPFHMSDNLYRYFSKGYKISITTEEINEKMRNRETFHFDYVDDENNKQILLLTPFGNGIDWYFVMMVNNVAFTEQSSQFILSSTIMLTVVMSAAILLMLALTISREATIRAMEKAKGQSEFLSNMSHEIRTPLNGLIGLNHLITLHIDDPGRRGQIQDWLRKSNSTANYLLSLVNDILDMSKLQSGKADIVNEPLLIETIVDAIWSMQRDNVEGRGIHFIVNQNILYPCVVGDAVRIKQVLMNIVGNAAKFTPEGGSITFSVEQEKIGEGDMVRTIYRCKDTGVGMSKEFTEKIFDAFSQERNKNSNSVKGTGLGMAISKLLVQAMGGDITVESELGKGTTFTVALPAQIAEDFHLPVEQTDEVTAMENAVLQSKRPTKILLAEDNALNAEILIEILQAEGLEVVHAQNGQISVDIFSKSQINEFTIILMDMQMPVMDGCAAAAEIRRLKRPDAKTVTIFACTANTFQEDRDRALKSGMNDFLAKPIDVNILLQKLSAILTKQNLNETDISLKDT